MILSLVVGVLLGAAAVIFAFQNTDIVSLSYLGRSFETSVALLVLMSIATGILISILVSLPSMVGSAFKIMSLKNQNRKLVNEVEEARRQAAASTIVVTEPDSTVVDLRSA
jgi:uncharacterized integral membrane protein